MNPNLGSIRDPFPGCAALPLHEMSIAAPHTFREPVVARVRNRLEHPLPAEAHLVTEACWPSRSRRAGGVPRRGGLFLYSITRARVARVRARRRHE